MLTENELEYACKVKYRLPSAGCDYVRACFVGDGSRQVGTHAKGNVVSWIPSPNPNEVTFASESYGPERALRTILQYSPDVSWYGDQPEPIDIVATIRGGHKRRSSYTADAIAITPQGIIVYEAKTSSKIDELVSTKPDDWQRIENGNVVYLPARKAFARFGLMHEVFVYKPEDAFYIANLNQLLWIRECEGIASIAPNAINRALEKNFTPTIAELKKQLSLSSYAPIYKAIDEGHLVVDLRNQLITEVNSCLTSTTVAMLEHGMELRNSQLIYRNGLIESKNLSLVPSLKAAEEALQRLEAINSGISDRNVRRWKERVRRGEKLGLSAFQSLISLHHLCGKRSSNINIKVERTLTSYLLETHIHHQGISYYRSFIDYTRIAREVHPELEPVCRKTFMRRLSKIPPDVIGYARGGKRMGNAMALPTDPEERNIRAQTAWEVAAIDHYCVDLFLILYVKNEKVIVERPWLTLMIDICTGKVLAFSISFKKPSRHAVAKVIRACVRNHGRLPREIILDRGAEFKSVYLASLLAHYSVTLSLRPASDPRYGGQVEGFFGEFKKLWLCQREGNLANFKEARSVDGSKAPRKSAVLFPADFHRELKMYCNWRENACRGIGGFSCEAHFAESEVEFPHIPRPVQYDSDFVIVTCIEAKKFTVDMQRGININGIWYSSPAMKLLLGRPKKNEVRMDPENPNLIFVRIGDEWKPFYSSDIKTYSAKSPEHQLAEGMIKHEAYTLKRKIRFEDDVELAQLVNEMNLVRAQSDATPILEAEITEPFGGQSGMFANLKNASVRPVKIQAWGA